MNGTRTCIIGLKFTMFVLTIGIQHLNAYDLPTHQTIAGRAVEVSSLSTYLQNQLGFGRGSQETFLGRTVEQWISTGARTEDIPSARVRHHFHNPLRPWAQAGLTFGIQLGESSLLWNQEPQQEGYSFAGSGSWSWHNARKQYLNALTRSTKSDREQSLADLFRSLGQGTHLLQDATVPAHVRDDAHLNVPVPFTNLFFPDPDGYEKWALNNAGTAAAFIGLNPIIPPFSIFTPTGDNRAPSPVARLFDTDKFQAGISGSLSDPALGISEFTNGNFLSKSTIFRDFTLPRATDLALNQPIEEIVNGRVARYISRSLPTGETVTHFVREGMLRKALRAVNLSPDISSSWVLDDRVHADYAGVLLPRAVGYSASLLDYFFRGKLDLSLVEDDMDPTIVRLEGKNDSSEKLDGGTLELYADDSQGLRSAATPVGTTTVTAEPGQSISVSYRLPNNAEKFMAVYKGKLGEEAAEGSFPGAVIGKVVEGVQVEQLFRDSTRWYVRNSQGVYPTEILVQDVQELQWGDNDNTLVGRSRLGPGESNLFYSYQINRPAGAGNVPLRTPAEPLPEQPETNLVVDIFETQQVPFPFGLDIGTQINFSQQINYKQYITSQVRTNRYVWMEPENEPPGYEFASSSVSNHKVDLVTTESQAISRTYPVVITPEILSTGGRPYNSFVSEIRLTDDGHILAMILLALTDPEEQTTFTRRQWTWNFTPGFAIIPASENPPFLIDSGLPLTVRYEFPLRAVIAELIWVLVDVTNGAIVASTAPPTISINYNKDVAVSGFVQIPFGGSAEFILDNLTGGGPKDGLYTNTIGAQPYLTFSEFPSLDRCPLTDMDRLTIVGELDFRHGDASISVNHFRDELSGLASASSRVITEETLRALSCSNPATGAAPIGLRFTGTRSEFRFTRTPQVLRTVPGSTPEQLVINAFHYPLGSPTGTYKHAKWSPAQQTAEIIKEYFGEDDYFMLGATPSNVLVQSFIAANGFSKGPKILEALDVGNPLISMTGVEQNDFHLLDPDYLYDADALKFYTKQSSPQLTTLPKSLAATSSGNPRGRYHVLRIRGPVN